MKNLFLSLSLFLASISYAQKGHVWEDPDDDGRYILVLTDKEPCGKLFAELPEEIIYEPGVNDELKPKITAINIVRDAARRAVFDDCQNVYRVKGESNTIMIGNKFYTW